MEFRAPSSFTQRRQDKNKDKNRARLVSRKAAWKRKKVIPAQGDYIRAKRLNTQSVSIFHRPGEKFVSFPPVLGLPVGVSSKL